MTVSQASFELWDQESRNLMGDYGTENEALVAVGKAVSTYGSDYADSIVLLRIGPRGGVKRIAAGADLAERAKEAARIPTTQSARGS